MDHLLANEQWEYVGAGHETLWALGDHLGTVRDLIDSSGTIRKHTAYDSFGNRMDEQHWDSSGNAVADGDAAAVDTLFGFTGRPLDEATGLQNNLNRWYNSKAGKWISEDPIGFGGGDENLHRYTGNRATDAIDADGLEWTIVTAAKLYPGEVAQAAKGLFWTGPKELVVGIYTVGRHPIQTAQGIHYAATHLPETGRAIACDFAEKISTSEGQGQLGFDLILTIATIGGGAAANVGRSGVGVVDDIADASKLRRLAQRGELRIRNPNFKPTPITHGRAGEVLSGLTGNKTKISINGRNRIPDVLTGTTLCEVENVANLSYTRQLRDFADYARQNGLVYELYVRPDTKLTGPLLEAIQNGDIILKTIPGL